MKITFPFQILLPNLLLHTFSWLLSSTLDTTASHLYPNQILPLFILHEAMWYTVAVSIRLVLFLIAHVDGHVADPAADPHHLLRRSVTIDTNENHFDDEPIWADYYEELNTPWRNHVINEIHTVLMTEALAGDRKKPFIERLRGVFDSFDEKISNQLFTSTAERLISNKGVVLDFFSNAGRAEMDTNRRSPFYHRMTGVRDAQLGGGLVLKSPPKEYCVLLNRLGLFIPPPTKEREIMKSKEEEWIQSLPRSDFHHVFEDNAAVHGTEGTEEVKKGAYSFTSILMGLLKLVNYIERNIAVSSSPLHKKWVLPVFLTVHMKGAVRSFGIGKAWEMNVLHELLFFFGSDHRGLFVSNFDATVGLPRSYSTVRYAPEDVSDEGVKEIAANMFIQIGMKTKPNKVVLLAKRVWKPFLKAFLEKNTLIMRYTLADKLLFPPSASALSASTSTSASVLQLSRENKDRLERVLKHLSLPFSVEEEPNLEAYYTSADAFGLDFVFEKEDLNESSSMASKATDCPGSLSEKEYSHPRLLDGNTLLQMMGTDLKLNEKLMYTPKLRAGLCPELVNHIGVMVHDVAHGRYVNEIKSGISRYIFAYVKKSSEAHGSNHTGLHEALKTFQEGLTVYGREGQTGIFDYMVRLQVLGLSRPWASIVTALTEKVHEIIPEMKTLAASYNEFMTASIYESPRELEKLKGRICGNHAIIMQKALATFKKDCEKKQQKDPDNVYDRLSRPPQFLSDCHFLLSLMTAEMMPLRVNGGNTKTLHVSLLLYGVWVAPLTMLQTTDTLEKFNTFECSSETNFADLKLYGQLNTRWQRDASQEQKAKSGLVDCLDPDDCIAGPRSASASISSTSSDVFVTAPNTPLRSASIIDESSAADGLIPSLVNFRNALSIALQFCVKATFYQRFRKEHGRSLLEFAGFTNIKDDHVDARNMFFTHVKDGLEWNARGGGHRGGSSSISPDKFSLCGYAYPYNSEDYGSGGRGRQNSPHFPQQGHCDKKYLFDEFLDITDGKGAMEQVYARDDSRRIHMNRIIFELPSYAKFNADMDKHCPLCEPTIKVNVYDYGVDLSKQKQHQSEIKERLFEVKKIRKDIQEILLESDKKQNEKLKEQMAKLKSIRETIPGFNIRGPKTVVYALSDITETMCKYKLQKETKVFGYVFSSSTLGDMPSLAIAQRVKPNGKASEERPVVQS